MFESASVEATFPRHSGFANVVGETLLPRAKDSADLFYLSTAIHTNSGLVGPFF